MDALSLNLPADVLSSPICIRPFKKVPVVKINLEHNISLPFSVWKPLILFLSKMKPVIGSEKTVKLQ